MKFDFLLSIMLLCVITTAYSQGIRCDWSGPQFIHVDSTEYDYSTDSSIVAGKNTLYWKTNAGLTSIISGDTLGGVFIGDFDTLEANKWGLILDTGLGNTHSLLYWSYDRGLTWQQDTTYLSAVQQIPELSSSSGYNQTMLNQLQVLGPDTLLLFVGYYQSGIIYSVDNGITWQSWFGGLLAFYHGLFRCSGSVFLWNEMADGVPGYMLELPEAALFAADTSAIMQNNLPYCAWAGNNPPAGCYYSGSYYLPSNIQYPCDITYYDFLKLVEDSLCSTAVVTSLKQPTLKSSWKVYPNPSVNHFTIEGDSGASQSAQIQVYDQYGRQVSVSMEQNYNQWLLDMGGNAAGIYWLQIQQDGGIETLRILKTSGD